MSCILVDAAVWRLALLLLRVTPCLHGYLPACLPRLCGADEEHLAACLQPPADTLLSPAGAPSSARMLQHSMTDTLMQLHAGHPSPGRGHAEGQLDLGGGEGRRRVTLGSGDPAAEAAGGRSARGQLGPAALQHSRSERPNSRGGVPGTLHDG